MSQKNELEHPYMPQSRNDDGKACGLCGKDEKQHLVPIHATAGGKQILCGFPKHQNT